MPIEATQLDNAPVPLEQCPKCHAYPFVPFMRGMVQRAKRNWKTLWLAKQPYCTLICSDCKEIVGHEYPPDTKAPGAN